MNVLMLSPSFYPQIGGVENHVKRISEELIKKGHFIIIITAKNQESLLDYEEIKTIKVYRFSCSNLWEIWLWLFRKRELICNADVIHCHDFSTFIYWYLPFRFLFPFKPVFITFHGHEGILPIPKKILIERRITNILTKGNICIGAYIPKWYGTKTNYILYGGVDGPAKNNIDEVLDYKKTLYVGRLERDTGIMAYIMAIKILEGKYCLKLEMDVYGDGSLRSTLEDYINRNGLKVKIHGVVREAFSDCPVGKFAFVSGYLAILEAMINKKLVFALYENELKKDYLTALPNSGNIMVIVSNPHELAEKLFYYYENRNKTEQKIITAYNFAKQQTWGKIADSYLRLWKEA